MHGRIAGLLAAGLLLSGAGAEVPAGEFDRLTEADRQALAARFKSEVWPLLERGGKDGCVGCHHVRSQSSLRFKGDAAADFRALLKDGFFLPDDSGSLLNRVETRDRQTRMPPGKRPAWTAEEAAVLRRFVEGVEKKQGKAGR